MISIVIPVRNESRHISSVLDKILCQNYPVDSYEVLVVDGESDDSTCEVVRGYVEGYPDRVRLFSNPKRLSSAARNIGICNARGELILIIDGHCIIDNLDMLSNVEVAFGVMLADCLGRPQPLEMGDATVLQWSIASCRRSLLGHHPDSHIYSAAGGFVPAISVAVAYRREVFDKVGLFDESFDACEDVELNYRVDRAGLRCYFDPKIAVRYVPRRTLSGLAYQMNRYGRGRVRLCQKHPDTFSIKSFGLGFFAAWLCLFAAASIIYEMSSDRIWCLDYFLRVSGIVMGTYLFVVCAESLRLALAQRKLLMLIYLPLVFLTIHISFGLGILQETLAILAKRIR
jgi:succinoglycan biosynthesis protein ExoA